MIDAIEVDKCIVSGKKITNGFGYIESQDGSVDFSIIHDLIMKGEHDGKVIYVIRNCVSREWTQILAKNFNKVIEQRGTHRLDDGFVSVQQIGSSQFAKNGSMYIKESHKVFDDIDRLLDGIPTHIVDILFLGKFLEENFLKQKIHFGPSRYKHGYACMATFRRWLDNGIMSLMPHEDAAQLAYAAKDNFEICKTSIIVAQNLCIEATGKGGELTIWNIQPDDDCRRSFDVLETGYPYPPKYIRYVDKVEVKLNAGDMYFMNGCFLHGVNNVINGTRITAGRFIGHVPNNKVVYWT
jgi:hypothetical protein